MTNNGRVPGALLRQGCAPCEQPCNIPPPSSHAHPHYPLFACRGGYSFIANLLPIHCLACIVFNRVSSRLYIAYAPWVILGALAAGACPL